MLPLSGGTSGGSWSSQRRRLVALTVGCWLAVAIVAAAAMALDQVVILLALVPLLAVEYWIEDRLEVIESLEAAGMHDAACLSPGEQALIDEVDGAGSEREARFVIARAMLAGSAVVRRHDYPTRGLLIVRSVAEAVQLLGLALVVLTAPAAAGVALGGLLWFLGGRSGARVLGSILGRSVRRTPVDDELRARWLGRERMLVRATALALLVVAAIRYL